MALVAHQHLIIANSMMKFLFNNIIVMLNWLQHFLSSRIKPGMTFNQLGITIFSILFLAACAPSARLIAEKHNFTSQAVKGGQFTFQSYQRITNSNLPYVIYIEGDGLAFRNKRTISDDPTPTHTTMLTLATLDTRPNVVYLARPCQYLLKENGAVCNYHYWTDKRMSEDSVSAINEAINTISHGGPVDLIGFSGGGGLAVLIAARNPRIRSIITVAGNLDHRSFNEHHRVKQTPASLNPIDYAKQVGTIPQLHLSGGIDKTVPPFIASGFIKKVGSSCARQEIIQSAGHHDGWKEVWPTILGEKVVCK